MKKVIYCLGAIALIACSVEDAKASLASKRLSTYCGMENTPKQITKEYNAATGETIVTNHNRGLSYTEKTQEELKQQKAKADGEVALLRLQNDRLEKQVVALQQAQIEGAKGINFLAEQLYTQQRLLTTQQELLKSCERDVGRIATFCDQVQAFIK